MVETPKPASSVVSPVVAKPTIVAKPLLAAIPTGMVVKCVLSDGKPGHVVIDNHACTRQVFTAVFLSLPDEKNSLPLIKVEINSLESLPYVVNEKYVLSLEPGKK